MHVQEGARSGMCTASGVILTLIFVFFREWAGYPDDWQWKDVPLVALSFSTFILFGLALWSVLSPSKTEKDPRMYIRARRIFGLALLVMLAALFYRWVPDIYGDLSRDPQLMAVDNAEGDTDMMSKFNFLIGTWNLEYKVPETAFSEAATGSGTGTFKRALNDRYVYFDYSCSLTTGDGQAHAVFAWDKRAGVYRFWWFEDSGAFQTATCNFVSDNMLFLNWHDTLLKQTFEKTDQDEVVLKMEHPDSSGEYQLVLEVTFTRKE